MPTRSSRCVAPFVELVEYQRSWPLSFALIAQELRSTMAGYEVRVEHIGSTAVPGMCAKPVLDVMLGAVSLADIEIALPRFAERGYRYRPEYQAQIPLRRYFVKDADIACPRVHLHAVEADGRLWQEHLAFRAALRSNRELAAKYARLKRELAASLNKSSYTEAKAPFIRGVLADAFAFHPAARARHAP